ncbi:MAG: hypothetical protein GY795_35810 [Desulfobacterales bacterium]|nr:hypothetical protein [Desulfobacterales bacterium]
MLFIPGGRVTYGCPVAGKQTCFSAMTIGRFFEYLITAWIIITANFFLPRLVPGDPLLYLTGEADGDTAVVIDEAAREKPGQL